MRGHMPHAMRRIKTAWLVANNYIFRQDFAIREKRPRFQRFSYDSGCGGCHTMRRTARAIGRVPIIDTPHPALFPDFVRDVNDILFWRLEFGREIFEPHENVSLYGYQCTLFNCCFIFSKRSTPMLLKRCSISTGTQFSMIKSPSRR